MLILHDKFGELIISYQLTKFKLNFKYFIF